LFVEARVSGPASKVCLLYISLQVLFIQEDQIVAVLLAVHN